MDKEIEFRSVYTTFSQDEVSLIKSLFDSSDIKYYIDNEYAAVTTSNKIMTVMVAIDYIKRAEELLAKLIK